MTTDIHITGIRREPLDIDRLAAVLVALAIFQAEQASGDEQTGEGADE